MSTTERRTVEIPLIVYLWCGVVAGSLIALANTVGHPKTCLQAPSPSSGSATIQATAGAVYACDVTSKRFRCVKMAECGEADSVQVEVH